MKRADIATLLDYNYWANRRILAAASGLSLQQLSAPAAFPWGSLRGRLVHILDAEFGWRTQLERGRETDQWQAAELHESDFPNLESIVQRAQQEESGMRSYLASLTDASLQDTIRYRTDEGHLRERRVWHCLYHVVNHGTQHRSEAAAILTDLGRSPGDLDFTLFLNENPQPPS